MDLNIQEHFRFSTIKIALLNVVYSIAVIIISLINLSSLYSGNYEVMKKINQELKTDKLLLTSFILILSGFNLVASIQLIVGAIQENVKHCIVWIAVHSIFLLFILPFLASEFFNREHGIGWTVLIAIVVVLYICIEFWTVFMLIKELKQQQNGNAYTSMNDYTPENYSLGQGFYFFQI